MGRECFLVHEFSAALSIVEAAVQAAEANNVKRVTAVNVEIGEFTFLIPEQLEFNFEIASKNTLIEGAKLNITLIKGQLKCSDCGYEGERRETLDLPPQIAVFAPMKCPECESSNTVLTGGKDFIIANIEAEVNAS
ncbi:MAG: hydrogenase maturation nickel metallochaperone HypA [Candidatus Thorarchaeota archaeon]|nr:hydrogenase maturation nickel metallochaperone HypA [Candidatus Thorarchaeota archaeon]